MKTSLVHVVLCSAVFLGACGDDDDGGGPAAPDAAVVSQTPPTGHDALEAWLTAGDYKAWHCEPAVHEARSPSPHGFNRICSNDVLAANVSGTADWPMGAAAVKELYAAADGAIVGYAVYLKQAADSAGGANWYWYERTPDGVVADGAGDSGTAKTICVGCHAAAGSDPAHTPSTGGRDQVYTPVP